MSLRILAYAERFLSRDELKPYTHINEFELQRDFNSTENSTEASTETMVNGTDYQAYLGEPLASYYEQEARGDRTREAGKTGRRRREKMI